VSQRRNRPTGRELARRRFASITSRRASPRRTFPTRDEMAKHDGADGPNQPGQLAVGSCCDNTLRLFIPRCHFRRRRRSGFPRERCASNAVCRANASAPRPCMLNASMRRRCGVRRAGSGRSTVQRIRPSVSFAGAFVRATAHRSNAAGFAPGAPARPAASLERLRRRHPRNLRENRRARVIALRRIGPPPRGPRAHARRMRATPGAGGPHPSRSESRQLNARRSRSNP